MNDKRKYLVNFSINGKSNYAFFNDHDSAKDFSESLNDASGVEIEEIKLDDIGIFLNLLEKNDSLNFVLVSLISADANISHEEYINNIKTLETFKYSLPFANETVKKIEQDIDSYIDLLKRELDELDINKK